MTAWPEKMITQAEAFAKAAEWPVAATLVFDITEQAGAVNVIELHCTHDNAAGKTCGQSMGQLRRGTVIYNGSLDEMLSMVLRHMVQAHDVPLNTRGKQDNGPSDGSTP